MAQPRFLPAMNYAYEAEPNNSFYIFADDDTYLVKPTILEKFESVPSDSYKAFGKLYCSWANLANQMQPFRYDCHPFLQGGAGIVLTHRIMSEMSPHLLDCNKRFNNPTFAGSMRFALCSERIFGIFNWSLDNFIENWRSSFSLQPKEVIPFEGLEFGPGTFHRMNTSDFYQANRAQFSQFKFNKKNYLIDLGTIVYRKKIINMYKDNYVACYVPGHRLIIPFLGEVYEASSKWMPYIEKKRIAGVEQKYNKITIRLLFDSTIKRGDIKQHNIIGKRSIFVYKIKTPEIKCF